MIINKINFIVLLFAVTAYQSRSIATPLVQLHSDERIVGGQPVDIEEIPFQVSLQYSYHFCGGSLISKKYVLTAAHCTQGSLASSMKVRIGSNQTDKGGILVPVKKVFIHEKYNPRTIDYDFSILELQKYKDFSNTRNYINLPVENFDIKDGTMLTISGWGNTLEIHAPRDILRVAQVPKANQRKCQAIYTTIGKITDRMLCAGYIEGGKDSCQGDSGGPLFLNNTLVGIVSWGFGCAKPIYPGVYARISSVRQWIRSITSI